MTKDQAISIFGPHSTDLARALEVTKSAISQWPHELDMMRSDRVLGAAVRLNRPIPPDLILQARQ